MTKEDKQLLLVDLSERLPYGVKVLDNSHKNYGSSKLINIGIDGSMLVDNEINDIQYYPIIDETKPYLRPISSMTEEEKDEYSSFVLREHDGYLNDDTPDYTGKHYVYTDNVNIFTDWLNAHHFDYRGLIPKGLAIEVTKENNPYKK